MAGYSQSNKQDNKACIKEPEVMQSGSIEMKQGMYGVDRLDLIVCDFSRIINVKEKCIHVIIVTKNDKS